MVQFNLKVGETFFVSLPKCFTGLMLALFTYKYKWRDACVNVFAWRWLVRKAQEYSTFNPFQDGVPCGDVTTQFTERIYLVNPIITKTINFIKYLINLITRTVTF